MSKVPMSRVIEVVEGILGSASHMDVDINDPALAEVAPQLTKSRVRLELSRRGISLTVPAGGTKISFSRIGALGSKGSEPEEVTKPVVEPKSRPKPKRSEHTFVPPKFTQDVMDILLDETGHPVAFIGPTGTGKTTLAHYLGKELGQKVFRIECYPGMTVEDFLGEKTIEVDEKTGQNYIKYDDGPVIKAMEEGLDEDGNETGPAGLLLIDEAGSMPTESIVMNGILGHGPRRKLYLNRDGGRCVTSHSKFRVILSGNNAGRGAQTAHESMYAAQLDAKDISTLDRVAFSFRFGYSRSTEKNIAMEKIGNDKVVGQLLKFRDAVRDNIRAGKLSSPFSTRSIVHISDGYRIFHDLGKALFYCIFEGKVTPSERPVYNEIAVAQIGVDLMNQFNDPDMDYMDG